MRSEEVIDREMDSAKETANQLDDNGEHLDALMAMAVYRTLRWVKGEGKEELDEELLEIDTDEDE